MDFTITNLLKAIYQCYKSISEQEPTPHFTLFEKTESEQDHQEQDATGLQTLINKEN